VSASAWSDGVLHVRLEGAAAAVDAATRKLGGEALAGPAAAAFWQSLREQTHPFFGGDAATALWRLSLPSVAPPLDLPGAPLIEWGGAQRWLRGGDATTVRAAAARAGGHATLFRGDARGNGVFQPLAPPLAQIHRRLKAAFDPHGVFNPGRMYPEF
jgi:glycolate oxidase FAD binding subunit